MNKAQQVIMMVEVSWSGWKEWAHVSSGNRVSVSFHTYHEQYLPAGMQSNEEAIKNGWLRISYFHYSGGRDNQFAVESWAVTPAAKALVFKIGLEHKVPIPIQVHWEAKKGMSPLVMTHKGIGRPRF
jgi:hypothetical protein